MDKQLFSQEYFQIITLTLKEREDHWKIFKTYIHSGQNIEDARMFQQMHLLSSESNQLTIFASNTNFGHDLDYSKFYHQCCFIIVFSLIYSYFYFISNINNNNKQQTKIHQRRVNIGCIIILNNINSNTNNQQQYQQQHQQHHLAEPIKHQINQKSREIMKSYALRFMI